MTERKQSAANLLYQMLRIRMAEEAIAREYPKQEMRCPTHLCIGQEAIAVGVCASLAKEDVVFSTHRSHGHYLARGGSLPAMIAELYGKAGGSSGGMGGSMHLVDLDANFLGAAPIVASTIPVAVGVALARKLQKKPGIAVAFFGDAAVEEGTAHEAFAYATLKKLAVLFVCENNLYSTVTPLRERQPNRPIAGLARGHGMRAWRQDGNDVHGVLALAKKAITSIRLRGGPVFLEFLTYRYLEHCGPYPDAASLRPPEELAWWKRKDPIIRMSTYCLKRELLTHDDIARMKVEITKEIAQAFSFAKTSPFPSLPVNNESIVYKG